MAPPFLHPSHRPRKVLSRPFLAWSVLGIAWSLAHVGLELGMGSRPYKLLVVPCVCIWALLLALAANGRRWALYAAIACGALGCYFIPVSHFAPGVHITRFGVFPWMVMAEEAGKAWVPAYNLLIYAGILIGAAILWTGARAKSEGGGLRLGGASLAILVGILVAACGVIRVIPDEGAASFDALAWWSWAGAVACGVMLSATLLQAQPPGAPTGPSVECNG